MSEDSSRRWLPLSVSTQPSANPRLSEERQLRESVAPCIALTLLKNGTLAEDGQDDEESAFSKISLNQEPYYKACRHLDEFVFAGKPCSYKRRLRDGERRAAKTGMKHVRAADGVVLTTASVIFQPMYLQNVGRGAAVNLCSGVNEPDTDYRHTSFKMLAPGEGFYIGLYVDTDSDEAFGEYELRLTFYDSLGYRYEELFPVKQFDPQADGKACVATHTVAAPLLIDGIERFKTAGLCDSLVGYLGNDEREN